MDDCVCARPSWAGKTYCGWPVCSCGGAIRPMEKPEIVSTADGVPGTVVLGLSGPLPDPRCPCCGARKFPDLEHGCEVAARGLQLMAEQLERTAARRNG